MCWIESGFCCCSISFVQPSRNWLYTYYKLKHNSKHNSKHNPDNRHNSNHRNHSNHGNHSNHRNHISIISVWDKPHREWQPHRQYWWCGFYERHKLLVLLSGFNSLVLSVFAAVGLISYRLMSKREGDTHWWGVYVDYKILPWSEIWVGG